MLLNQVRTMKRSRRKKARVVNKEQPQDSVLASLSRMKLFKFHENVRPAYWGTFSKKSKTIHPRKPFAKDEVVYYCAAQC